MNVFDKFLTGQTAGINWCFENRHFIDRLNDNGLSREYIVDCLMNEEPISYEHVEADKYAVVYKAPENKDYKGVKKIKISKCWRNTYLTVILTFLLAFL
jgi:hypothetical protein